MLYTHGAVSQVGGVRQANDELLHVCVLSHFCHQPHIAVQLKATCPESAQELHGNQLVDNGTEDGP
jgi:hypothetical protein